MRCSNTVYKNKIRHFFPFTRKFIGKWENDTWKILFNIQHLSKYIYNLTSIQQNNNLRIKTSIQWISEVG